jgi:transcriptional regulator with XRE-family HTH domain
VSPSLTNGARLVITSEQIRAARAMLRWEQKTLAEESKVSLATVKRIEGKPGPAIANRPTIDSLSRALESAGVIFVEENGEGPGVRLRKATK